MSGRGEVYGGLGNDTITASGGGRFDGGPGNDTLSKAENLSGSDSARMFGGPGNDAISTLDVFCDDASGPCTSTLIRLPDRVSCGSGRDRVTVGAGDVAARDCERVERER
jgi:Ca2+-binding RTX toxin-like protein